MLKIDQLNEKLLYKKGFLEWRKTKKPNSYLNVTNK